MEPESTQKQWYALYVRSRFEKVVSAHLQGKGYEQYLPTYRRRRMWSDRIKEVDVALFPGYVFCKFAFDQRLPLLTVPGVVSVVTFGGKPLPVCEHELLSVQSVAKSGLPYEPWPYINAGQPVRVERGPLQGLEGVITYVKNSGRLIISVSLLRRSVSVEIDPACVATVLNTNDLPALRTDGDFDIRRPLLRNRPRYDPNVGIGT